MHAWATIDPDYALMQARALDRMPSSRGPLHGVPIGVKDIINTEHLPTEMGSPIYKGHRSHGDAACVALARMAGAVILGKTVTAEFAGMFPGPTANPHNPAHTPGGSSSGSAASVADFHVPLAYGTQTGGSVLRPASYLRLRRLQADLQPDQPPGHLLRGRDARHHRAAHAHGRRRRVHHRRAGQQAAGVSAARLPAAARPLPHAAVGHRRRADQARGRGRRQAARRRRRIGEGDRAAGGIREALLHRARDHQQLRALQEHGRRLAASSRTRSARCWAIASRRASR